MGVSVGVLHTYTGGLRQTWFKPMKILILDDHTLFREGMKLLLSGLHPELTIHDAETMDAALAALEANTYDLMLLDLNLAETQGLKTLEVVKHKLEGTPIIVLSAHQDPPTIYQAIEDGAMGFITKCATHQELLAAIKLILAGGIFLPREVTSAQSVVSVKSAAQSSESEILNALSDRQKEVLKYLLQGKPNKTISANLHISENTVKAHLSAIFRALGARNRTEAVYFAARAGVPLD